MKRKLKSIAAGFAAGLAIAAAAAQAGEAQTHAQHQQHQAQPATPPAGQHQGMQHGGMMMDPAMHQQMMERMRQCHDTMSTMMRRMEEMDSRHGTASQQHGAPPQGQHQGMQQGGMMDPAIHQQMMERMRQCHDTMSTMMRHMEEMRPRHGTPNRQP